jgi:hypothetical protein
MFEVEITDESLVPDEYCTVTVTMPVPLWIAFVQRKDFNMRDFAEPGSVKESPRSPSLSLIAEALSQPCQKCGSVPAVRYSTEGITDEPDGAVGVAVCPECGGSGRRSVAGAQLKPQGQHVECR